MISAGIGEKVIQAGCIQQALMNAAWPVPSTNGNPYRAAAVLLPLFVHQDQWHLLYIRRSETVQDHKGQVAFPGGAVETCDSSIIATALRETHEEVGIHPADVIVLGQMGRMLTPTNYLITPVVGLIPWPYAIRLQDNEVVRAFSIPLNWLAEPRHHEIQEIELRGRQAMVNFFDLYDGEKLWGITAQITLDFIRVIQSCPA